MSALSATRCGPSVCATRDCDSRSPASQHYRRCCSLVNPLLRHNVPPPPFRQLDLEPRIDQVSELAAPLLDPMQRIAHLVGKLAVSLVQDQVGIENHAMERRSHLMQQREELGFLLLCLGEPTRMSSTSPDVRTGLFCWVETVSGEPRPAPVRTDRNCRRCMSFLLGKFSRTESATVLA